MGETSKERCTLLDTLPDEVLSRIAGAQHTVSFSYNTQDKDGRFLVAKIGDFKIRMKLLVYNLDDIKRYTIWSSKGKGEEWLPAESEYIKRIKDLDDQRRLLENFFNGEVCSAYFDRTRLMLNAENVIIETDTFLFTFPRTREILQSLRDAVICATTEIEDSD